MDVALWSLCWAGGGGCLGWGQCLCFLGMCCRPNLCQSLAGGGAVVSMDRFPKVEVIAAAKIKGSVGGRWFSLEMPEGSRNGPQRPRAS